MKRAASVVTFVALVVGLAGFTGAVAAVVAGGGGGSASEPSGARVADRSERSTARVAGSSERSGAPVAGGSRGDEAARSSARIAVNGNGKRRSVREERAARASDVPAPRRTLGSSPVAVGPAYRAGLAGAVVPSARALRSARRWADTRQGRVSFAVVDTRGRLSGQGSREAFPSASMVKAMLLVAYLDQPARRARALGSSEKALLDPMVRVSDNRAASAVYAQVGDPGLILLARRARMRGFRPAGYWANTGITAADQARFFRRVTQLTPSRHRPYARRLLGGVAPEQSWGVPEAAEPRWRSFYKGGWRRSATGRLVHQAALLERGDERLALAVLTDGNPSHEYGAATIRGVAARLLR